MQDTIFIQFTPNSNYSFDESFLDLEFAFDLTDRLLPQPQIQLVEKSNNDVHFQPLEILSDSYSLRNFTTTESDRSEQMGNQILRQSDGSENTKNKTSVAKSKKTKNICFNICQKTVKVMKTRIYDHKLQEMSQQLGLNSQKVIKKVLQIKKDLTGPKALQMFVDTQEPVNKAFKRFMRWFLQQKYLRHAINQGSMEDLKGYIEFKNQVILNIL